MGSSLLSIQKMPSVVVELNVEEMQQHSTQSFVVQSFATVYYDTFAVARNHVIGRSACALAGHVIYIGQSSSFQVICIPGCFQISSAL